MAKFEADIELLRTVPIFASLSDEKLAEIIAAPDNGIVTFKSLDNIIAEGEVGDCMYILLDGLVDVRITAVGGREITIASMKPGEFFGEQALLPGTSGLRNASVRAMRDCQLFKITKKDVALGLLESDDFPSIDIDSDEIPDTERIRMLIRSVRLFRSLSKKDLDRIDTWTEVVTYEPGEIIMREAEEGDYMYIVLDGSVEVFITDEDGKIVILSKLKKGNYFGEQALLPDGPGKRNANVRTSELTTLVRVAKKYFQLIVSHDNKLMLALKAVGDSQYDKIIKAIGRPFNN